MPEADYKKLEVAKAKYNTTMREIVLSGIDKELLIRELVQKYDKDFPVGKNTDFDTEKMLEKMVERKKRIATEFAARIVF